MSGCERCRDALGGYVLGALESTEARAVEEHLARCEDCRAEHAALARLPALLELADPSLAPAERPPARVEERVLDRYAHSRRPRGPARRTPDGTAPGRTRPARRRGRLVAVAAAGAAAGVAASALALALLAPGAPPPTPGKTVRLAAPEGRASGTATLTARAEGTSVRLEARDLRPTRGTQVYEVWFLRGSETVSAGTFRVASDGRVDTRLSAAARPRRDAKIAVTREPDRADPAPSETVVLAGRV